MKEYKRVSKSYKLVCESSPIGIKDVQIKKSEHLEKYARQLYDDGSMDVYESFYIIFLNQANNTLGSAKISQGGIAGTVVDIRIVAKLALDVLATSVMLVHNHPSGNSKPSRADHNITRDIKQGLKLLNIDVLDHIILTSSDYYSFADEGVLF